jgi:hypothetical protein
MCYAVENEGELRDVIQAILKDEVLFAVVTLGGEWVETTLIRRGQPVDIPKFAGREVAQIVSWSGKYDRTVSAATSV